MMRSQSELEALETLIRDRFDLNPGIPPSNQRDYVRGIRDALLWVQCWLDVDELDIVPRGRSSADLNRSRFVR